VRASLNYASVERLAIVSIVTSLVLLTTSMTYHKLTENVLPSKLSRRFS